MENNELFRSFEYVVGNHFVFEKQVGVKVFYIYQDVYAIPLPLLIKKVKGKDNAYYLDEAKKIINRMIEDGSLKKYSDEYIKEEKKKRFFLLFFLSFLVTGAIAGVSVGTYFALRSVVYEVFCDVNNVTVVKPEAKKGEDYITQISFAPTTKATLPRELDKVLINGVESTDYTYTLNYGSLTAEFYIPAKYVTGKVEIFLTPSEIKKWYKHTDWYYYCSSGVDGEEANDEDIGLTVKLKVNNQDHEVRLIGLDHDELSDGNGEAHTTFQFANYLCDDEGHSFGVVEDLRKKLDFTDYSGDYPNSILRKNLTGKGNGKICWFQKDEQSKSKQYDNMTMMDMLPDGLKKSLKEVKKTIYTDVDGDLAYEKSYYFDKLFVPTYREMYPEGSDFDWAYYPDEGSTYDYYFGDSPLRFFNQISLDEYHPQPPIRIYDFKEYQVNPLNYAGFNFGGGPNESNTLAVFASPANDGTDEGSFCLLGADPMYQPTSCEALGIVPCFCI